MTDPASAQTTTQRAPQVGRVGIVGLGLIGGSLLTRLTADGVDVVGYNRGPVNREAARAAGLTVEDDLTRLARKADLIVIAQPLDALNATLRHIASVASDGTVLTDVTSVKRAVLDIARHVAPTLNFVGGHPMAGTELSGFAAARADLFEGAAWVVCREEDTDGPAWEAVAHLARTVGARVVETTAAAHDTAVARISHVPHLLAAALAAAAVDAMPPGAADLALELAAGSFRDGTRVAATRPELSAAMCAGNRDAVLAALDSVTARLAAARAALEKGGSDGAPDADLLEFFAAGRAARSAWPRGTYPA